MGSPMLEVMANPADRVSAVSSKEGILNGDRA